jgi:hypothetical protein
VPLPTNTPRPVVTTVKPVAKTPTPRPTTKHS